MIDTKGKKICDVTCGSRSIWFDKHHPAAGCPKKKVKQDPKILERMLKENNDR